MHVNTTGQDLRNSAGFQLANSAVHNTMTLSLALFGHKILKGFPSFFQSIPGVDIGMRTMHGKVIPFVQTAQAGNGVTPLEVALLVNKLAVPLLFFYFTESRAPFYGMGIGVVNHFAGNPLNWPWH